jgi:Ca-activated chloride channel family protein
MISHIHFQHPLWLQALWTLPAIALLIYGSRRFKRSTYLLGNTQLVQNTPGILKVNWIPWIFRMLILALCFVAAAGPEWGTKKVQQKKQVADLFIALDTSSSMLSMDLKPNRITAAKNLLSRFLNRLHGVRVGLCVFAALSFTQCPLTTDLKVVQALLKHVSIFSVRIDGTAIGDALVSCLERLQSGSQVPLGKNPVKFHQPPLSRAILLLTDGGNNCGSVSPITAALIAAREGIPIYTVGIGSVKGAPEPVLLPDGQLTYVLDQQGHVIRTHVAIHLLKQIAKISGGKFFLASNNHVLRHILNQISKLNRGHIVKVTRWKYRDLSHDVLKIAFALLVVDLLMEATVFRTLP